MAATPSIKVDKTFAYRGVTRTWSNRYHFNGGTPADSAHWTTFSDAVVNAEKLTLASTSTIVKTTGYAAGSDVPVFTKTYSQVGTRSVGTGTQAPGDCASLIRFSTTARTPKNHPVYLFNWYHDTWFVAGSPDVLESSYKTILGTYATAWISGFSDGTNTYVRAGPNGATATGQIVDNSIVHRDFPR